MVLHCMWAVSEQQAAHALLAALRQHIRWIWFSKLGGTACRPNHGLCGRLTSQATVRPTLHRYCRNMRKGICAHVSMNCPRCGMQQPTTLTRLCSAP